MKARIEEDKTRAWRRVKDKRVSKRVYNYEINTKRMEKKVIDSARVAKDWIKTLKSNQYVINMSAGAYHGVFLPMVTVWQEEGVLEDGKVRCRLVDVGVGVVGEKAMHGVDILIRITMEEEGLEDQDVTIHCFHMKAKVLIQSKGAVRFTNKVFEPKMLRAMEKSKNDIDGLNEEILKMAVEKRKRESTPMVGPKLKCEHCDKFFNNRGEMTTHMRSKHFTRFESSFLLEDEKDPTEMENVSELNFQQDTLTETVKKDDEAKTLATKADENSKPDTKTEKVKSNDKAKTLATKVDENNKPDSKTEKVKSDDKAKTLATKVDEKNKPDTKIEKVNSDDKAKGLADKVDENNKPDTQTEKVKSYDKADTSAAIVVDKMKSNKVNKISSIEVMVKETLEEVLRNFNFDNISEKEKNKSQSVEIDSTNETRTIDDVSKAETEKVPNKEPLNPKVNIIEIINDEDDEEKKESSRKNNVNNDEVKVLEIGKKRKNPVKPSVETVSSCSHTEETDEGFSCERCQVMCSSMADLLHHVAETHEEGSLTNFLIYNIAEDNKKMKEEMKNIQLALDFVLRDNQTLQDLNLQTAVKLEAALSVIQEGKVDGEPQLTEEEKDLPTTNKETKEDDWVVLDEYNSKEETVQVKTKENVLWIGTSLSDQHLDAKKLSVKTNTNVKKIKAFTIVAEDGKYKPEMNVEDVANKELEINTYKVVVIEVGVNEVSNLDLRKAPHLLKQEMKKKMEKLHLMAVKMTMKFQGMRVVLLERVARIDSDQRANQARGADQAMWNCWYANGKPENIILEKMKMNVKSREERDEVFGRLGERTWKGKFNDGIHLLGKYGSKEFTHRACNLLRRVLRTEGKESRRFQEVSNVNTRAEVDRKEEKRRKTSEKRKADEKNRRSNERRKEERRKLEERKTNDDKLKRDEERSRYNERRRIEDNRRKDEYERIQYERKRDEEKRLDEERIRRLNNINKREEESRRRIRENRLREENRRRREERMRKSDEKQKQEMDRKQDYEKRRVERDARHDEIEKEEKREMRRERMQPRYTYAGESSEKLRNLDRAQGREREAWREVRRGATYSRREERRGAVWDRPMGKREEEREGYDQNQYPPLKRAGNERWGAPGAPRRWA